MISALNVYYLRVFTTAGSEFGCTPLESKQSKQGSIDSNWVLNSPDIPPFATVKPGEVSHIEY